LRTYGCKPHYSLLLIIGFFAIVFLCYQFDLDINIYELLIFSIISILLFKGAKLFQSARKENIN